MVSKLLKIHNFSLLKNVNKNIINYKKILSTNLSMIYDTSVERFSKSLDIF